MCSFIINYFAVTKGLDLTVNCIFIHNTTHFLKLKSAEGQSAKECFRKTNVNQSFVKLIDKTRSVCPSASSFCRNICKPALNIVLSTQYLEQSLYDVHFYYKVFCINKGIRTYSYLHFYTQYSVGSITGSFCSDKY